MAAIGLRLGALAAAACLVACGGDDPTAPAPQPQPLVDDALVGTWQGGIKGTSGTQSGSADIQVELDDTGIVRVSPSNPPFHDIPTGSWGIVDGEFRASGTDTHGTTVTFSAPRSATRLQGTWQTGTASGTFDVTKQ